jgi:hypothetical protein
LNGSYRRVTIRRFLKDRVLERQLQRCDARRDFAKTLVLRVDLSDQRLDPNRDVPIGRKRCRPPHASQSAMTAAAIHTFRAERAAML